MTEYRIGEEIWNGRTVCCLCGGNLRVLVDMSDGMNTVSICYRGTEQIDYNQERYEKGVTYGIPVLYPTPNRVKDGVFTFEGAKCSCPMHGLVRKAPFAEIARSVNKTGASITGEVSFEEGTERFTHFPFKSRLQIQIALQQNSLTWTYTVFNDGEKPLPYGFALHPFFVRRSEALIRTNADFVMNADAEKFPDGSLVPVAGTALDLSAFTSVDSLNLDAVYYKSGASQNPIFAQISYPRENLRLDMESSRESNHLVVFTPQNTEFFCIEPQTCSTDCHNLYARGFTAESNLLLVPPAESRQGWISMTFRQEQ